MGRFIRQILSVLGYKIVYVSDWGEHAYRYDSIDRTMCRPVHQGMSVAPPWAKMRIKAIYGSPADPGRSDANGKS